MLGFKVFDRFGLGCCLLFCLLLTHKLLQVATQIAVLIGKIARYDCPRSWTQLVPTLVEAVRVNDALCQQRALLTFHHVAKVLASKRLMHDRKLFEEVASGDRLQTFRPNATKSGRPYEVMYMSSWGTPPPPPRGPVARPRGVSPEGFNLVGITLSHDSIT